MNRHEHGDGARVVARTTAIFSIAAGVVHVSAAGDHTNLPVMLAGFLLVAALQLALGAALLTMRVPRWVLAGGVALMAASIALWVVSRATGLPFLEDGHMEPIGVKDAVTKLFEVAAVPGLLALMTRSIDELRVPRQLGTQALQLAAVTTVALMVPALVLAGGEHHTHDEAVELGIHGHDGEPGGPGEAHVLGESEHAKRDGDRRHGARRGHGRGDRERKHGRRGHDRARGHDGERGHHGSSLPGDDELASAEGHGHDGSETEGTTRRGSSHGHDRGRRPHKGKGDHKRGHDRKRGRPHRDRPGGHGRGDDHGDHEGGEEPEPGPPCNVELVAAVATPLCP